MKKPEFVLIDEKCGLCGQILSASERFDCSAQKMIPICAICIPLYKKTLLELQPLWENLSLS